MGFLIMFYIVDFQQPSLLDKIMITLFVITIFLYIIKFFLLIIKERKKK